LSSGARTSNAQVPNLVGTRSGRPRPWRSGSKPKNRRENEGRRALRRASATIQPAPVPHQKELGRRGRLARRNTRGPSHRPGPAPRFFRGLPRFPESSERAGGSSFRKPAEVRQPFRWLLRSVFQRIRGSDGLRPFRNPFRFQGRIDERRSGRPLDFFLTS